MKEGWDEGRLGYRKVGMKEGLDAGWDIMSQ